MAQVIARPGDTLCGLAMAAGFPDCQRIRDEPANAGKPFLDRHFLLPGEIVEVPSVESKEEGGKATEQLHQFEALNSPPVLIRFVHGSKSTPYRQDETLTVLNISNFVTTNAGSNGLSKPFPTGTMFNQNAHDDPDTFKLEVVDPKAGGSVKVKLEALKPVYNAAGVFDHVEEFSGQDKTDRSLEVDGKAVPSKVCFRSPYLRLVVDEEDKKALPKQTLLVTDKADGNNSDNDRMEILDQRVRASYEIPRCPGSKKCTATAELPIGTNRQRIRMVIHAFRAAVGGGNVAINGITEANMRRRTFRFFRRYYAQCSMGPKLIDPQVEFLDPPEANMLVLSQGHGRSAAGVSAAGGLSNITFTLASPPGASPSFSSANVTVPLTPALTPAAAAAAVVSALPAGFVGQAFTVQQSFTAAQGAADVLITRTDGARVIIRNETTNDTTLTVAVPRPITGQPTLISQVSIATSASTPMTMEQRRVCRAAPGTDDRLDIYVIGQLTDAAGSRVARGVAMIACLDLQGNFRPPPEFRFGALMETANVMDGGEQSPFSYPHEAGHVMGDIFHARPSDPNGRNQLMTGNGTSRTNAVDASKRVCDLPIQVRYQMFDPAQPTPGAFANDPRIPLEPRIRTRGASVHEPW